MKKKHISDGRHFQKRFGISIDDKVSRIVTRVSDLNSKDFEY